MNWILKIQITLAQQEIELKVKNKAAEELISVVGAESDRVSKEKAFGKKMKFYYMQILYILNV